MKNLLIKLHFFPYCRKIEQNALFKTLSVFQGADSCRFLKNSTKIRNAAETAPVAYLAYGKAFFFKHLLCQNYASFQNIIHNRHSEGILKAAAKIIFTDVCLSADLINSYGLKNIFIYIVQCFTERARCRGNTVYRIFLNQMYKVGDRRNIHRTRSLAICFTKNFRNAILKRLRYLGINK